MAFFPEIKIFVVKGVVCSKSCHAEDVPDLRCFIALGRSFEAAARARISRAAREPLNGPNTLP